MVFNSRATAHWVVALLVVLSASVASGQQPKRKEPPPPFALLPAEQSWLITLESPPAADGAMNGDRVFIPLQSKRLIALNRDTGVVEWMRDLEAAWAPIAVGDALYVVTANAIHALDAATGTTSWERPLERALLTAPIVDAGRIIVVLEQGDYVSVSATDGTEQWRLRIPNNAPLFPPAAGGDGHLYVALDDGRVVAIADGQIIWMQQLERTLSAPAWAPDRVFVGSTNNYFYALDADNGNIEWKWRAGGDVIGASAGIDGRIFFVSLDNMLFGLNQGNGNQRWRKVVTTRPALPPRVIEDIVLVTSVAPVVTSYASRTGEIVGSFTAASELQGAPLVDPVLKPFKVAMVVITRDGRVAGLRPTAMLFKEPALSPITTLPGTRLGREARP